MKPELICRRPLPPQQLREAEISPAVLEIARGLPGIKRVVRELGLSQHTSRIDVAAITETDLVGFEIKSDADRLGQRWRHQSSAWELIFDLLWIVITNKHMKTVFNDRVITKIVPDSWGVLVVRIVDQEIHVFKYRDPEPQTGIANSAVLQCLWKTEATRLVRRELGWKSDRTDRPMREWYPEAAEAMGTEVLKSALREALVTRNHLHKRDGSI